MGGDSSSGVTDNKVRNTGTQEEKIEGEYENLY